MTLPYRYTVWMKRSGNLNDGYSHHGVEWNKVNSLSGTPQGNPYFWASRLPQLDTWYLMVGYVHASDYTGGDLGISGVYDTDGNKVMDGTEFKWANTTTQSLFRSYMYYATNTNTRQYFWSPVVQKIDGNEDSLDDIISTTAVFNNEEIVAKDIVTHVEYDGFGRQAKQYLPYAATNSDGRFETSAKEGIQNYYLNNYGVDFPGITDPADINAYSETIFENSPLNRAIEQTAPGLDWKQTDVLVTDKEYSTGHTIKMEYGFNAANEVRYFPVTTTVSADTYTPSLGSSSYYNANELTKNITKDENWSVADGANKTTEEFTNKSGQVVLKRTYNNSQAHDTYYVYDDYGNLTYVFPPKVNTTDGISASELSELCYQYVYDHRNRLVEKKIPGKGWEYIVYNRKDQPVLTQDALQRQSNKWLFTKYDALGRVTYTGEYISSNSRSNIQNTVNSQSAMNLYEDTLTLTTSVLGGEDVNYTYRSFPNTTNVTVYTINYYDEYLGTPSGLTTPTLVYDQNVTTNTQGLATVSKVRVLTTNDWITTVTYYDEKARPVYVYSKNDYLQTVDIAESKLDFIGKVVETRMTHQKNGQADIVIIDQFEYDHMDRMMSQVQKINNELPEQIVRNVYDDLGQLKTKLVGDGVQKGYSNVSSGILVNKDIISKTSSVSGFDTGLSTLGSISGDGYIEFEPIQSNLGFIVGLADTNPDAGYLNMDFALYLTGSGTLLAVENGNFINLNTTYIANDVFRIERVNSTLLYKKNDTIVYKSTKMNNGILFGDVSIGSSNTQIRNLRIVAADKGLQNVDYSYNIRGWLKSINDDNQDDNDLFNFSLRYNDPTSGTALFNGNISQTHWSTASQNTTNNPVSSSYTYSYDALNRITSALDNTGNYDLTGVTYDMLGNIITLQRMGHINASATLFGMMDDLSYTYDSGNKLTQVDDVSGKAEGFKNVSGVDYTYDVNGNMISDNNKGISSISYNHLNLPVNITFNNGGNIYYKYDATGIKLSKEVESSTDDPISTVYAGNFIYEVLEGEDPELQFFNHAEGYVKHESSKFGYVYQYKDHLGNVRFSYTDADDNGVIDIIKTPGEFIEDLTYYPFGLKHKGYNNVTSSNGNSTAQKWGFQEQEIVDDLGLNVHEWKYRVSDPAIGRFWQIDPLAEDYVHNGTYNFSENRLIDARELEGLEAAMIKAATENNVSKKASNTKKTEKPKAVGTEATLVSIKSNRTVGGYPGQALEEGITQGIQWLVGKATDSDVSRETSENIQMGGDIMIFLFSKGKNVDAGTDIVENLVKKKGTKQNLKKAAKDRLELPSLDATGKVHGKLPGAKDLSKYSPDELKQLAKELKQSVNKRIQKNVEFGRDRAHGQRQGAEQDLLQSINKYLKDLK